MPKKPSEKEGNNKRGGGFSEEVACAKTEKGFAKKKGAPPHLRRKKTNKKKKSIKVFENKGRQGIQREKEVLVEEEGHNELMEKINKNPRRKKI